MMRLTTDFCVPGPKKSLVISATSGADQDETAVLRLWRTGRGDEGSSVLAVVGQSSDVVAGGRR